MALFSFGAYFEYKASLGYLEWLPLACLTVFIIAFSMGPGPLGWILLGELMSPKIAGAYHVNQHKSDTSKEKKALLLLYTVEVK